MRPDQSAFTRAKWFAKGLGVVSMTSATGLTVNAYVIRSAGAQVLIDSGYPTTVDQLEAGLNDLGTSLTEVSKILYTHAHVDHMGGGVALAGDYRIKHVAWQDTTPLKQDYYDFYDANNGWLPWIRSLVEPGPMLELLLKVVRSEPSVPAARVGSGMVERFKGVPHGHIERVGEVELHCVDARGHGAFHVVWHAPARGWVFTGDQVLRRHPPIFGFLNDDLRSYRRTLVRLRGLGDVPLVLPGHGSPREGFRGALDESWRLTRRVYEETARALASGSTDALTVANAILPRGAQNLIQLSALLGVVEQQLKCFENLYVVERRGFRWHMLPDEEVPAFDERWGV